jgi:hypothetical protein
MSTIWKPRPPKSVRAQLTNIADIIGEATTLRTRAAHFDGHVSRRAFATVKVGDAERVINASIELARRHESLAASERKSVTAAHLVVQFGLPAAYSWAVGIGASLLRGLGGRLLSLSLDEFEQIHDELAVRYGKAWSVLVRERISDDGRLRIEPSSKPSDVNIAEVLRDMMHLSATSVIPWGRAAAFLSKLRARASSQGWASHRALARAVASELFQAHYEHGAWSVGDADVLASIADAKRLTTALDLNPRRLWSGSSRGGDLRVRTGLDAVLDAESVTAASVARDGLLRFLSVAPAAAELARATRSQLLARLAEVDFPEADVIRDCQDVALVARNRQTFEVVIHALKELGLGPDSLAPACVAYLVHKLTCSPRRSRYLKMHSAGMRALAVRLGARFHWKIDIEAGFDEAKEEDFYVQKGRTLKMSAGLSHDLSDKDVERWEGDMSPGDGAIREQEAKEAYRGGCFVDVESNELPVFSSTDEVHAAILVFAPDYIDLMPQRLRTREFFEKELPKFWATRDACADAEPNASSNGGTGGYGRRSARVIRSYRDIEVPELVERIRRFLAQDISDKMAGAIIRQCDHHETPARARRAIGV